MYTPKEVRKELEFWEDSTARTLKEMLLAHVDLLEAMEDFDANPPRYTENPAELIRQRAAEKKKARNRNG